MTKHRMKGTPEYWAWQHAKRRCNDPKDRMFPLYGAKGIKMCPQWENDFQAFFNEVGLRPSRLHSLDRIKSHLGYEPGNVRWATKEVQAQNRPGFVKLIEFEGRSQTVAQWARELGIPAPTIHQRLSVGKTAEQALMRGRLYSEKSARLLSHDGKTLPLKTWAKLLAMPPQTIRRRLDAGWPIEKALVKA